MISKVYIHIIFFLLTILSVNGQEPPMWQLTDEEGLPSMTVYDIIQDQFGYMWFGTAKGLSRFDGNEFKRYTNSASKGKGITNLQIDNQGKIWCQNFAGQFFYIEEDKMKILELPKEVNNVRNFLITDEKLIIDTNPTYIYSIKTKKWQKRQLVPNKHTLIHFLKDDSEGNIWISDRRGIKKYNKNLKQLDEVSNKSQNNLRFISSKQKIIYINEENTNQFYQINNKSKILNHDIFFTKNIRINAIWEDKLQSLWLATYEGIFIFDKNRKPQQPFSHILKDKSVSHILQDREGNYWVTTLRSGIFVIPNLNIIYYNQNNSEIFQNNINKLSKDNVGNIYIGFNNGKIAKFNFNQGFQEKYKITKYNNIEELFYDTKKEELWVACNVLYHKPNNLDKLLQVFSLGVTKDVERLFNHYLLVATSSGTYIIKTDREKVENKLNQYPNKNNNIITLSHDRAYKVHVEQGSRRFWIAYKKGLFYYENAKAYEIKNPKNQQPIYGISFTQTDDGSLWVGTIEQGIFRIKDKKIIEHYDTKNGLVSNFCNVLQSQKNELWIATDGGIQVYNIQNKKWELFNKQDGLVSYDIMDMIVSNDSIWIGTPKGLLFFKKKAIQKNSTPPLIYINTVQVWDKNMKLSDKYILRHGNNNIKISFKGIAYRSKGKFRYKYRMIGLDSTWIYSESSNNFIRYQSLPTGKYEFQVKAVNEDNIESEGIAVIEFIIQPPLWQRLWFILLLSFLVILIVFLIFRSRLKNIKRKAKIEKDLRSSQLAMLKVQMNPHFIFNALNSIQEFILLNESRLANRFLGKFADLIRLTLEMSNQTEVNIEEEIDALKLYLELEALRFENSLEYAFDVEKKIEDKSIKIPSLLIQPYVENAIKHGLLHKKENRKLFISLKLVDNDTALECIIRDNGIGRAKSQEINKSKKYKSFAMSATQKRLELLNHNRNELIAVKIIDLYDNNLNAAGTKVELCIPV